MKKLINLTMFDLLKGIAMLLVMFGHSFGGENAELGEWFGRILYSVLMPSFFVVSGYWLKKKKFKVGLKSSVEYLLFPYCVVMILINCVGLAHRLLQGELQEWVTNFLIPSALVMTFRPNRVGPMWFVFALFLAWFIFYIVIHIQSERVQYALVLFAAILGGALLPLNLPFQIAQGLIAFFYVYCGYILKKKKLLDKKHHPILYVVLALAWLVTVIFGSMNLYEHDVKYGIFSILGSLCGAYILIKIFLYINLLEWRVLDGIRWIGRYSMWFLCLHTIEHGAFPWGILFKFVNQGTLHASLVFFVLRLILVIIGCVVLQKMRQYWIARKEKK